MPSAIDWPDDLGARACEFYLHYNNTLFESPLTNKRQNLRRQGDRFVCQATFRVSRANAQRIDAMLARLKGVSGTVTLWDFARTHPLGDNRDRGAIEDTFFTDGTSFSDGTLFDGGAGEVTLFGTHAAGASRVPTDGWYPNVTVLKAGDYVSIAGMLHVLTADAESDGTGLAHLDLAPGLRRRIAHGAVVSRTRARGDFYLRDDGQPNRPARVNGAYEYTLSFVEAI